MNEFNNKCKNVEVNNLPDQLLLTARQKNRTKKCVWKQYAN